MKLTPQQENIAQQAAAGPMATTDEQQRLAEYYELSQRLLESTDREGVGRQR